MGWRGGRVVAVACAVGLVTAMLPAGAAGAVPARPKPVRIPVGSYAGVVSSSASFGGGPGLQIKSQGFGPLRITASDTSVSGTWAWSGRGRGSLTRGSVGGTVDAALSFSGVAKGTPVAPELDGTFTINGTFTAAGEFGGLTGPINVSVDAGFPLDVHATSCQKIAGDFVPLFRENVQGAGLTLKGAAGKWVAFHVPAKITTDLQESLDTLVENIEELQAAFESGAPIDSSRLLDLLLRVELLAKNLPVDKACKSTKKTGVFSSFLAASVAVLIGSALPRVDELSLDELTKIADTAHQIGLFTSPDSTIRDLERHLRDAIDDKLTAAITAGDTLGIELVERTAKQLGWKDLSERAAVALKK